MTAADEARDLVTRTTSAQGLPEKIDDMAVLDRLARLVVEAEHADDRQES